MYDLIIIGMGVSGISAGIYAKRAGLKVLMIEESAPGGIINSIPKIENYPGIKEISGPDLAYNLFEQVNNLNIEYKLEKVTDVILEDIKTVKTTNDLYQSKYLLIASGRRPRLLGLENELEYLGKGISTCALCDGSLYKGKDVAVVGGGSSALTEAIYLSKIVNKVYLIHRREEFRGEDTLINEVKEISNIELVLNNEITDLIIKDNEFKGIILKDNKELIVSCLFEYIGYIPNTEFLKSTNIKLDHQYIVVNNKHLTNIKEVYASGDVTQKEIYQIVNAASEGAEAIINITK
ncbi:MAG: thioredoxin-disulfide reductase [Firmicutes bacterium]|nr:thioredoxin-disulfide reductase [Bacillota bacterium]